jgi:hypothetical protein
VAAGVVASCVAAGFWLQAASSKALLKPVANRL